MWRDESLWKWETEWKSEGHTLTLVIMTSATEVAQPASCGSDTETRESMRCHPRFIPGEPLRCGNKDQLWPCLERKSPPFWWLGHTTSLHDWHEWLTTHLQTHDPSRTCVIYYNNINVKNDPTHHPCIHLLDQLHHCSRALPTGLYLPVIFIFLWDQVTRCHCTRLLMLKSLEQDTQPVPR